MNVHVPKFKIYLVCKQIQAAVLYQYIYVYVLATDASARTLNFPVELTTTRFGNLTRLIHNTLL